MKQVTGSIPLQAGQGEAAIVKPFDAKYLYANKEARAANKAAQAKAKAKSREDFNAQLDWAYDTAFAPFEDNAKQMREDVFKTQVGYFNSNQERPLTGEQRGDVEIMRSNYDSYVSKTDAYKDQVKIVRNTYTNSDFYNEDYATDKLNSRMTADGESGNPNVEALNGFYDDPSVYNAGNIANEVLKNLENTVRANITNKKVPLGYARETRTVEFDPIFELGGNGLPKRDDDGNPIVKISDETVDMLMDDGMMSSYVNAVTSQPDNKKTKREVIEDILKERGTYKEKLATTGTVRPHAATVKEEKKLKGAVSYLENLFNREGDYVQNFKTNLLDSFADNKGIKIEFQKRYSNDGVVDYPSFTVKKPIRNIYTKQIEGYEEEKLNFDPLDGEAMGTAVAWLRSNLKEFNNVPQGELMEKMRESSMKNVYEQLKEKSAADVSRTLKMSEEHAQRWIDAGLSYGEYANFFKTARRKPFETDL